MSNKILKLNEIYNILTYENLSEEECLMKLRVSSDKLTERWINSNFEDFSVYQDLKYIDELLLCYHFVTKYNINNTLNFFKENNIDKNVKIFDDYNGIGLSTILLLLNGYKNIYYFNDNNNQVEIFKRLVNYFGLGNVKRLVERDGDFDIVLSFEIAEHYKNPKLYIEEIKSLSKKYLIFSSGFRNVHVGHFPFYEIDKKEVNIKESGYFIEEFIKKDFDLIEEFELKKPQIYIRR